MYRWLVRKALVWVLGQLRAGRPRPLFLLLAPDIHFRFPGEHSWAADFHGREEAKRWLQRYVRVGLQLHPQEIVVGGPPWRMTIFTRFTDHAADPDGTIVYRNEGVLVDTLVWGRIKRHVSYEDTQKTLAFDHYLERARPDALTG